MSRGACRGVAHERSVEKHTSPGGGVGIDIQSNISPPDGGSYKLDAIIEMERLLFVGILD